MHTLQKIVFAIMPSSWRAHIQAESERWMLKCPNCGFERSYWDAGGIRWRAAGNKTVFGKCPNCGQNVGFAVYKKNSPA